MHDSVIPFALRETPPEDVGNSLGRSFAEYSASHGQAMLIAGFARDASTAGVFAILAERAYDAMGVAEEIGILRWTERKSKTNRDFASDIAEHQLRIADYGTKCAAIVMLHNACEQFLYRLLRFGLVANRTKALEWIAKRQVTISEIVENDAETLIDDRLEKWWSELERASIVEKFDKLIALMGYPVKLQDKAWCFDRDMLSRFDEIRHNAVHHDGHGVQPFDLDEFAKQLQRALLVCVVHVADKLQLQIPAEVFFGLK
jgi:hypothetical protein